MNTIAGNVLTGIDEVLKLHDSPALHTFRKIIHGGLVGLPPISRGGESITIYGSLTADVSLEDGNMILRALETIEKEHDCDEFFADMNMDGLIMYWRQFAMQPSQTIE